MPPRKKVIRMDEDKKEEKVEEAEVIDEPKQTSSPVPTGVRQEVPTIDFYEALKKVGQGRKITKLEWDNIQIYGLLQHGTLMIHKADNKIYQWILSEGDLIGTDWIILSN